MSLDRFDRLDRINSARVAQDYAKIYKLQARPIIFSAHQPSVPNLRLWDMGHAWDEL